MNFAALPEIMVAPNGARRTTADHPALPVTIPQTVATAKACFEAGAGALQGGSLELAEPSGMGTAAKSMPRGASGEQGS